MRTVGRRSPASTGMLPNLLIIGAAKSGTTSLHHYLDLHPSVYMSRIKELRLFIRDDWREHLDWYRAQFDSALPVRGESSPAYSMHPWIPGVPERVKQVIPETRLIYLVRDPVERLVAQYVEFFALRLEHRSLEDALADYGSPSNRFVMASRFAYQLERYRALFPDSQILVLDQRDLLVSRAATLREVFNFLGVDSEFNAPEFEHVYNERNRKMRAKPYALWLSRRGLLQRIRERSQVLPDGIRERLKLLAADPIRTPTVDPHLRAELAECLREDAERLRAYTGKPFAHWSL
jgi:sulfotransferase family protein